VAPTIKPHSDSQYDRHQKCEMNFWVPVGRAFGNNALRVESRPGANDFVTITLSENQYFRFDEYNCTHFTVPNDTDYTRVSFDFRVVPASLYRPHADANGQKKSDGKIGDYRAECTGPVALREPLRGQSPDAFRVHKRGSRWRDAWRYERGGGACGESHQLRFLSIKTPNAVPPRKRAPVNKYAYRTASSFVTPRRRVWRRTRRAPCLCAHRARRPPMRTPLSRTRGRARPPCRARSTPS